MSKTKKILCAVLALAMLIGVFSVVPINASTPGSSAGGVSSAERPRGLPKKQNTGIKKSQKRLENNTGKNVLVIQTNSPWSTDGNESVLSTLLYEGYIDEYTVSSVLDSVYMDYSEYSMILIANDQDYTTYNQYNKIKYNIEKYASSGGVVLFGACDNGWADGVFNATLPGDVEKNEEFSYYNYVSNRDNAFAKGDFYTKVPIEDDMLYCHYCSHVNFSEESLPEKTDIILRSSDSQSPTLVQYPYGDGNIIASGLTWEFAYNDVGYNLYGQYYPDLILYALSFSDSKEETGFKNVDSGFRIKVDGNNFCHTNEKASDYPNSGFSGVKNYNMSSSYYDKLVNMSSKGEKSSVKSYINYGNTGRWSLIKELFGGGDYWGGSCYGIASTMALKYNNIIGLKDLTKKNVNNYFSIGTPWNDTKFLNVIQYYQVSQLLEMGGSGYASKAKTVNDTNLSNQEYDYSNLRSFLKTLVSEASTGKVTVMGFSTADSGHAVVITGCEYDKSSGKYRVKIYDENTVGFKPADKPNLNVDGKFSYMEISKDYRYFNWSEEKLNNSTYIDMYILDLHKMKRLDGTVSAGDYIDNVNHTYIVCSTADSFRIENDYGESLVFDGQGLSGDMDVYSFSTFENISADGEESSPSIKLEVDSSSSYSVSGMNDTLDVSVYNSEDYVALSGEKIEEADLSFDNGISIDGDNYTFSAFTNTEEEVKKDENNLVSISAKASGETKVEVEGNKAVATSENTLTDVSVSNYVGSGVTTQEVDDSTEIMIDNFYKEEPEKTEPKTVVKLTAGKKTINVGSYTTVKAKITNGAGKTIFSSSNNKIATVNSAGKVVGKKAGTVTIKANNNSVTASIKIKVVKKANPMTVKTKTIKAKKAKTMKFAKTKAFTVKNAKGKVVFQKIKGNKNILVSKDGKITVKKGLKKKTYKITVKVTAMGNNTYKAKYKVVTLSVKVK